MPPGGNEPTLGYEDEGCGLVDPLRCLLWALSHPRTAWSWLFTGFVLERYSDQAAEAIGRAMRARDRKKLS